MSLKQRSRSSFGESFTPAEQHALITHVAETHVEQLARHFGDERRDGLRVVDVRVHREGYAAGNGFLRHAIESVEHFVLKEMLRDSRHSLTRQADVADIFDVEQATR